MEQLADPVTDENAYATVYGVDDIVIKIIDSGYIRRSQPAENLSLLRERGVPHATSIAIDGGDRSDRSSVVLQERYDADVDDAAATVEQYVTDVVDVAEVGLEQGLVLRDVKLVNFARFDGMMKLYDVSDDELAIAYYNDPDGPDRFYRHNPGPVTSYLNPGDSVADRFQKDAAAMYRTVIRSAAVYTEQATATVAGAARYLSDMRRDERVTVGDVRLSLDGIADRLPAHDGTPQNAWEIQAGEGVL